MIKQLKRYYVENRKKTNKYYSIKHKKILKLKMKLAIY